jgi:hypothetical protein
VLSLADGQRMTIYQAEPGSRGHDALTLLSMIASGDEPRERRPVAEPAASDNLQDREVACGSVWSSRRPN